jgi:hypothetical protein
MEDVEMKCKTKMTVAALLFASGLAANVQQANAQQRVTVIGCPTAGVELNCLVIRGADNNTYNISGARQRPQPSQRAIRLSGMTSKKTSYCQQGVVLENIVWSYTDQNCK